MKNLLYWILTLAFIVMMYFIMLDDAAMGF
jgi:hypothetical protein